MPSILDGYVFTNDEVFENYLQKRKLLESQVKNM